MKQVDLRLAGAATHAYTDTLTILHNWGTHVSQKSGIGVFFSLSFITFQYQTICTAPILEPTRFCKPTHTK